jgi:hypothetical protein
MAGCSVGVIILSLKDERRKWTLGPRTRISRMWGAMVSGMLRIHSLPEHPHRNGWELGPYPPLLPSELPLSSLVETTEGTWQRARWRKSGGGAEEANMLFRTAGLHGEQWSLSFWKAYRDTDVDDKLTAPPMYWKIHLQDL